MSMLKNVIRNLAKRFGNEIVPDWLSDDVPLRDHLRYLFSTYNIDCIIDVGANVGQYGDFLRKIVGYKGEIISFEPIDTVFQKLQDVSMQDARWVAYNCALGEEESDKTINIMGSTALSSFLLPDQNVFEKTGLQNQIRNSKIVEKKLVKVRTLDSVLEKLEFENIYLKMDTQGYDRFVLEGGKNFIYKVRALQTEAAVQKLYANSTGYMEMIHFVEEHGFELSGFFPVNRDAMFRLIEMDIVFVRGSID